MPIYDGFIVGVIGGVAAELLRWFNLRETLAERAPTYIKSIGYWLVTILMILLGGALVSMYIYDGVQFGAILAFNVGASAPLVIAKFVDRIPEI